MRKPLLFAALLAVACPVFAAPVPAPTGQEKSLFDGKTLAGWESPSPELWSVRDGCLTGGNGQRVPHNDFLCTTARFENFVLRLKIKLTGDPKTGLINSGVQIRTERHPKDFEVGGYQCDYGEPAWFGSIYDEGRRDKLLAQSDMAALRPVLHPSDWDDYVIKANGRHIQTWINGVQGVDYLEPDEAIPQTGILGIQVHGGGNTLVQVKDVLIEELPPTSDRDQFRGAPAAAAPPHESPLSPEEERKTFSLPPGFNIELVAAESEGIGKFVTVDWDQRGRLWTQTAMEYPVDGNESPAQAASLYANPGRDKVLVFDSVAGPGPHQPRVFADGLAIPLGILPYGNGVYVQHGPNTEFLEDTDGDGKADRRRLILSGFGYQDSHLMMHQFTRLPGGWIWTAEGAFNKGVIKTTAGEQIPFENCRMARFRADGSAFEPLCTGPCNIWGFEIWPDGEKFIQEANDYGYPVMPFSIGGSYPGCADRLFKSYAPQYPGLEKDFRMGGTGLSGLAFSDPNGSFSGAYAGAMYVANPIIRKIQALRLLPEGPRWGLAKLPDFIESSDPMFRPVSIHFGPDGALYIVDWYNKIISHNEVPRNHPDRDKRRGRIWRVTQQGQALQTMPDLTTCPPKELVQVLLGDNARQSHLAWQAIGDRQLFTLAPPLRAAVEDATMGAGHRIRALWALEELRDPDLWSVAKPLLTSPDRNLRREAVEIMPRGERSWPELIGLLEPLAADPDPEVRAAVIRAVSGFESGSAKNAVGVGAKLPEGAVGERVLQLLVGMGQASLSGPMEPATRDGKPMKVREAYDREFERYLVREALEQNPTAVGAFLGSPAAARLPVENRLLATLALEPRASAIRLAELLPQANRAPDDEELLRLAQFPREPGVGEALQALLQREQSRNGALEGLLRVRNRLDANALTPMLTVTAKALLEGDAGSQKLGLRLVSDFELAGAEAELLAKVRSHGQLLPEQMVGCLNALEQIRSSAAPLFLEVFKKASSEPIRQASLQALARSPAPEAPAQVLALWKDLTPPQRHAVLDRLTATPAGAHAMVEKLQDHTIENESLDDAILDRLQTVLGDDPALAALLKELGTVLRPVLRLEGGHDSYADPGLSLEGPFTVETWVRLDPGIDNNDGLLGSPGQLDINFFDQKLRVWVGGQTNDAVVANKKLVPDNWTHVAITRDEQGAFRLYLDGELDQDRGKTELKKFEHVRIGWAQPSKGTNGMLAEYRIWKGARTAEQIRDGFDRAIDDTHKPADLLFHGAGADTWGKLHGKAHVMRTTDHPPLLSAEEAVTLDGKFAKYRALAKQPGGDPGRGKAVAAICMACHLIQGQGGTIAPNISGAGTMGVEALLRNIITPNAAIEAGYRTYRVEMKNGDLVEGFFVNEDPQAIVVRLSGQPDRRLPKSEIRQSKFIRRSLMPEGILDALAPEQVTDLFSYLMSLKG